MADLNGRDPVKPHVEDTIGNVASDVQGQEVKIESHHAPSLEILDDLQQRTTHMSSDSHSYPAILCYTLPFQSCSENWGIASVLGD